MPYSSNKPAWAGDDDDTVSNAPVTPITLVAIIRRRSSIILNDDVDCRLWVVEDSETTEKAEAEGTKSKADQIVNFIFFLGR